MEPAPAPRPVPTVLQQWIVIAVFGVVFAVLLAADLAVQTRPSELTGFRMIGGGVAALGHALWITLDRQRRGREVGLWRFAAIITGPFAVWLYLCSEYGLRGFVWVLVSLGVYGGIGALAELFTLISA